MLPDHEQQEPNQQSVAIADWFDPVCKSPEYRHKRSSRLVNITEPRHTRAEPATNQQFRPIRSCMQLNRASPQLSYGRVNATNSRRPRITRPRDQPVNSAPWHDGWQHAQADALLTLTPSPLPWQLLLVPPFWARLTVNSYLNSDALPQPRTIYYAHLCYTTLQDWTNLTCHNPSAIA